MTAEKIEKKRKSNKKQKRRSKREQLLGYIDFTNVLSCTVFNNSTEITLYFDKFFLS